jgi:acyl-CoA synthetase (AMP-forming)/AMP-acid ligase II
MTYLGRTWTWAQWHDRVRRLAGACGRSGSAAATWSPSSTRTTRRASSSAWPRLARRGQRDRELAARRRRGRLRRQRRGREGAARRQRADAAGRGSSGTGCPRRARHRGDPGRRATATSTRPGWPSSEPVDRSRTTSTPDDVCLVMYSSGTTGHPKGVMLTHANMVAHTVNAHDGWEFEPGDKSMVAMPLFHVGGSSYVLFGIHDGIPSVMTRDPDGASLAGAILAGRQPHLPGAGRAGAGAPGRTGRVACSGNAAHLHLRRLPDAACPCCAPRWRRGPRPTSSRSTG